MAPTEEETEKEDDLEVEEEEEDEDRDADGVTDDEQEASDEDAEAVDDEEDDDDDDEEEDEVVGAVKKRATRERSKPTNADESESDGDDANDNASSDDNSSAIVDDDWEAANEGNDDMDATHAAASRCIFCQQDEEHDPGEEFEEYLSCSVCGDNAHRQCARDAACLTADDDASRWRCKDCVANGLEADFKNVPEMLSSRRRTSAPKMARDLLPQARGGIDPESHSVFNTLILDADPMDGSRALRKRKSSSHEVDDNPRPANRKRQKGSIEKVDVEEEETKDADDHDDSDEAPEDVGMNDANDDSESADKVNGDDEKAGSPKSRSSRPQRNLKVRKKGAWIASRSEDPKTCVLVIAITPAQWDDVERSVLKKRRRRERDRQRRIRNTRQTATAEPEEMSHFPAVQTTMYSNPFYAFPDRETDETRGKPYGGILTDAEADTARTYPQDSDRQAFQDARTKAEQRWAEKLANVPQDTPARAKTASGPPSKIKCINFGQWEIDTWHAAPYPEEYSRNKHLYICEFCLKYMSSDYVAWRHKLKCSAKCPPGDEIYRSQMTNPETGAETTLSFFEVDGRRNPLYCQNLCLLAKLFLGSKTLYYDVEPFLFYVMTENDDYGCHFVGYFSKEKRGCGPPPPLNPFDRSQGFADPNGADASGDHPIDPVLSNPGNNVSCILVLPVHMRRGFGRVLIEFSYLLTKVERRTGSPEKPLSDMGLVSYRSYWRGVLCHLLLRYKTQNTNGETLSVVQIARETGMTPDDIISTLEALRFLVRDPVTHRYALRLDYDYMKEYVDKHEQKATIKLDPTKLCWTPYVMGRPTNLFTMGEEANQPMQTVAPRDDPVELNDAPKEVVQRTISVKQEEDGVAEDEEMVDAPEPAVEEIEGLDDSVVVANPDNIQVAPVTSAITSELKLGTNRSLTDLLKKTSSPSRAASVPEVNDLDDSNLQRRSPRKTPNGSIPFHHTISGDSTSDPSAVSDSRPTSAGTPSSIPPTRFEVFPPIPGMHSSISLAGYSSGKRRPGRPTRGRRRSGHTTPVRRTAAARAAAAVARAARSEAKKAAAAALAGAGTGSSTVPTLAPSSPFDPSTPAVPSSNPPPSSRRGQPSSRGRNARSRGRGRGNGRSTRSRLSNMPMIASDVLGLQEEEGGEEEAGVDVHDFESGAVENEHDDEEEGGEDEAEEEDENEDDDVYNLEGEGEEDEDEDEDEEDGDVEADGDPDEDADADAVSDDDDNVIKYD